MIMVRTPKQSRIFVLQRLCQQIKNMKPAASAQPQAAAESATQVSRVIICGGGIIGTAVSYYLAKKGVMSTVVDRCGLAAAASGRAGAQELILLGASSAKPAQLQWCTLFQ
jgi:alkyl hydroperoxide reductase subunit AhpF